MIMRHDTVSVRTQLAGTFLMGNPIECQNDFINRDGPDGKSLH